MVKTQRVNMPTVSIVIPTSGNRADLLRQALKSVLTQTYHDYEIIVIENGPQERSKETVQEFIKSGTPIRYFYSSELNGANARNIGVRESKGQYIAFLDDDDTWFPEKLKEQVSFLKQNELIGLVSCHCVRVKELEGVTDILPTRSFNHISYSTIVKNGPVIPSLSSVVMRRECFDKIGFFDPKFTISDDHEFYLRVAERYGIFILEEPLFYYRWHTSNISKKSLRMYQEKVSILKSVRPESSLGVSKADIHQSVLNYGNNFYALATGYKEKKQYIEAAEHYWAAVQCDPFVGLRITWSRMKNPIYRFIRPYILIFYCAVKCLRFV